MPQAFSNGVRAFVRKSWRRARWLTQVGPTPWGTALSHAHYKYARGGGIVPYGPFSGTLGGECHAKKAFPALRLSTRIRNYSDVSKDRSLTVAALIGAPTVREGLLQNTRSYLRNGVLRSMRPFYLQNQDRIRQTVTGQFETPAIGQTLSDPVSYTHLRAHETRH